MEIKFRCYEEIGFDVYRYEPEVHGDPADPSKLRIIMADEVKPGTVIIVPGLGNHYFVMTVNADGTAVTESGNMMAILEQQDGKLRCGGLVNRKALQKLELHSDEGVK